MKHRVLNSKLNAVTGWHNSFPNAAHKCLDTMNQQLVWFIEDSDKEVSAIIHCRNVWVPIDKKQLEHEEEATRP
jgi:hypothetical protein